MDKKEFNEILDKRFKEQNKELTSAIERQSKMMLEEFEHRFSIVAEVQVDHTQKLNAIIEMTVLNTENIEMMKNMLKWKVDFEEYEILVKRVSNLEKKLRLTKA